MKLKKIKIDEWNPFYFGKRISLFAKFIKLITWPLYTFLYFFWMAICILVTSPEIYRKLMSSMWTLTSNAFDEITKPMWGSHNKLYEYILPDMTLIEPKPINTHNPLLDED